MTVIEAMRDAVEFLESLGYKGGDVIDNLKASIELVEGEDVAEYPLPENYPPVVRAIHSRIWDDITDRRGIGQEIDRMYQLDQLQLNADIAKIIYDTLNPAEATLSAKRIAEKVYDDLEGRSGIGDQMSRIDADIQEEIKNTLAEYVISELKLAKVRT